MSIGNAEIDGRLGHRSSCATLSLRKRDASVVCTSYHRVPSLRRFEPVAPINPNPVVGKLKRKQTQEEWLIRQDEFNDLVIGRHQTVSSSEKTFQHSA